MTMRRIMALAALAAIALIPALGRAQDAKEQTKDTDSSKATPMTAGDMGLGGDGLVIERMEYEEMTFDPDTKNLTLTGQVSIKSDQFSLRGQSVRKVDKNIFATGSPVNIEVPQKDGTIKATAKNATYNLETKKMRLEGNPIVHQQTAEKRVTLTGDIIEFDQKGGLTVKKKDNSSRLSTYAETPVKAAKAPKQTEKAKKVNSNNLDLIRVPQPDTGS